MSDANVTVALHFREVNARIMSDVQRGISDARRRVREYNEEVRNGHAAMGQFMAMAAPLLGLMGLRGVGQAAMEGARSQTALAGALRNVGQYSPEYVAALNAQADALQYFVDGGDDAIRAAQAQLITFGASQRQVEELIPKIVDWAAAQRMDLASATRLVSRVVAGGTAEFAEHGIVLDATKPKVEALAEALERFSGRAKDAIALREWNEFSTEIGNLQRDVGGLFYVLTAGLAGDISASLRSANEIVKALTERLRTATEEGTALGVALDHIGTAVMRLGGALLAVTTLSIGFRGLTSVLRRLSTILSAVMVALTGYNIHTALTLWGMMVKEYGFLAGTIGMLNRHLGITAVLLRSVGMLAIGVGAAYAGWSIGKFLGDLRAGHMTVSGWIQGIFLVWGETAEVWWTRIGAFMKQGWVTVFEAVKRMFDGVVAFMARKLADLLDKIPGVGSAADGARSLEAGARSAAARRAPGVHKELKNLEQERDKEINAIRAKYTARYEALFDEEQRNSGQPDPSGTPPPDSNAAAERKLAAMRLELREAELAAERDMIESAKHERLISIDEYLAKRQVAMATEMALLIERNEFELKAIEDVDERTLQADILAVERRRREQREAREIAEIRATAAADEIQTNLRVTEMLREQLVAERTLAEIRGDRATVNRLIEEERQLIDALIEDYMLLAEVAADPAEREAANARIGGLKVERENVGGGDEDLTPMEGLIGGFEDYADSIGTVGEQIRSEVFSIAQDMETGIGGAIEGLIMRTMTWSEALAHIGRSIVSSIIRSFAQMVAQYITARLTMKLINMMASKAEATTSSSMAMASAAAWAPAAIAASIASYGTAAAIGTAAFLAGMAMGTAAAAVVSGVGGAGAAMADGGLVRGPGGDRDDLIPARLSAGEYVMPAARVRSIGLDNLEQMRRTGQIPQQLLSNGGATALQAPKTPPTPPPQVHVVAVPDASALRDQVEQLEGQIHILRMRMA